jgi:hypothetical protein
MLFILIKNIIYIINKDLFPFIVFIVKLNYLQLLRLRTKKPITFTSILIIRFRFKP